MLDNDYYLEIRSEMALERILILFMTHCLGLTTKYAHRLNMEDSTPHRTAAPNLCSGDTIGLLSFG
ncbi:protein of unknown function [Pseudodesulfovibrio profundus]|uniref:Uncharacterized protein n=1 Tax=Pseudodesulfovibrio profundus TaxID=57320 RepID=A0A2C8FB25_9BACT|nr:protein of unknown function [Pseudodesulfovibrio profundus]